MLQAAVTDKWFDQQVADRLTAKLTKFVNPQQPSAKPVRHVRFDSKSLGLPRTGFNRPLLSSHPKENIPLKMA